MCYTNWLRTLAYTIPKALQSQLNVLAKPTTLPPFKKNSVFPKKHIN